MEQASSSADLLPFWQAFLAATGRQDDVAFYEAFYFADSEDDANSLGQLVLAGVKRATAALVWGPASGDLSIVTDWSGRPLCVIETTATAVVPFEEVTEEFAATEGEGDKSLRYWREVHWDFFSRECGQIGREPSLRMPVLCERFRVVYPLPSTDAA